MGAERKGSLFIDSSRLNGDIVISRKLDDDAILTKTSCSWMILAKNTGCLKVRVPFFRWFQLMASCLKTRVPFFGC
jgi:hypothetical protein